MVNEIFEQTQESMDKSIDALKRDFARKPVGPFAPKTDSLLPLYAPRPMLELFCRSTAMVIAIASTICTIKSVDVIYASFYFVYPKRKFGYNFGDYTQKSLKQR